ncbi:hypothetical protein IVB18_41270 [Bradyrhizobium sp. 186]|nr:hypothetical protein IVB18_41270 [Bradyrhizobium sp. 186]
MLYALGIGMGADPMDEKELAFVNEATGTARPLKVVPTFASVAAGFAEPGEFNLNSIALDGERDIAFHSTLLSAAHFTADSSVIAVYEGFPKPILHGMCTYGITCRGILQTYADYDPSAFRRHAARFSSPLYPGETLTLKIWKDGDVISFEASVKARGVTVVKNGMTMLA